MNDSTKLRVLVVDDNEDATDILAVVLTQHGMVVETAYDGLAGLAAAESCRPDVMLIDLHMPKMGGLELARAIRALPWGRTLPLLAITAWGHRAMRAEVRDAGFDDHLVKPVGLAQVLAAIARIQPQLVATAGSPSIPSGASEDSGNGQFEQGE